MAVLLTESLMELETKIYRLKIKREKATI